MVSGSDTDGAATSETYTYDSLARITNVARVIKAETFTSGQGYDSFGRVSQIVYPGGFTVNQLYNSNGYVQSLVNASNSVVVWQVNTQDARGNTTQFTLGNGVVTNQTFDNDFGRVNTIQASKAGIFLQNQAFTFDSIGNLTRRIKRTDTVGGSVISTVYVGNNYERSTSGTIVRNRFYIGNVAVLEGFPGSETITYLHRDHAGSIVAKSKANLQSPADVEWISNDSWGVRKQTNWTGTPIAKPYFPAATNEGYTGQEHLDMVGLIHLNGRVYDPELGRFLSADPYVQSPFNSQSLNRYSYVMNNPLSLVDPSGFDPSYCIQIDNGSCQPVAPGGCHGDFSGPGLTHTCPGNSSNEEMDRERALEESIRVNTPQIPNSPDSMGYYPIEAVNAVLRGIFSYSGRGKDALDSCIIGGEGIAACGKAAMHSPIAPVAVVRGISGISQLVRLLDFTRRTNQTGESLSAEGKALSNANPVGSALKEDSLHRAATFVREEAAANGTHFPITGGDGVTRTLTQIRGELNGVPGRYEYIVDEAGNLTHQRFVQGGSINGIPNKP